MNDKRRNKEEDSDSEDDFGPSLPQEQVQEKKKIKISQYNPQDKKKIDLKIIKSLKNIPSTSSYYEYSFLHRDNLSHILVSSVHNFIITVSVDGHLKFWKKFYNSIEFVKHYQIYIGMVSDARLSADESLLIVCSENSSLVKVFDVLNFDLINMIDLSTKNHSISPSKVLFLTNPVTKYSNIFAVADKNSSNIFLYKLNEDKDKEKTDSVLQKNKQTENEEEDDDEEDQREPFNIIQLHSSPVVSMDFNFLAQKVVSIDSSGQIEYWDVPDQILSYTPPLDLELQFTHKFSTDLFHFMKHNKKEEKKLVPITLKISKNGSLFSVYCTNKKIFVFSFATGKLLGSYDDGIEMNRKRLVGKKEISEKKEEEGSEGSNGSITNVINEESLIREEEYDEMFKLFHRFITIQYDETDSFLFFPSYNGIKILSLDYFKIVKTIGNQEHHLRFLCFDIYQGTPTVDHQYLLKLASSSGNLPSSSDSSTSANLTQNDIKNLLDNKSILTDPTIFAAAYNSKRFFCFSHRPPADFKSLLEAKEKHFKTFFKQPSNFIKRFGYNNNTRDKMNELVQEFPTSNTSSTTSSSSFAQEIKQKEALASKVILHTTLGEIHLKLFPNDCPLTVRNFVTHVNNGYYNNVIFHRVIKGFMIQTGDPLGTGTGGTSIYGKEFKDEFVDKLCHDRPYTLSMANAGPNTNGSQFFITTAPTPWLDKKHTVFGRVVRGYEVVHAIENVKVDKNDRPYDTIKIISANVDIDE